MFVHDWRDLEQQEGEFLTTYDEVCDTFDDMGLKENLLRGIYAYGTALVLILF